MTEKKALAHIKEALLGATRADRLLEALPLLGQDPYVETVLMETRQSIAKIQGHAAIAQKSVDALIAKYQKSAK